MDWRSIGIILIGALLLSSCGATSGPPRAPLGDDQPVPSPSVGQRSNAIGRDSLAYQVVLTDKRTISVELTTRFELVIRENKRASKSKPKARRIDLAKADFDILDLVATRDGSTVYVASTAGWVRGYDVDSGEMLSEWRMGSSATALALSDDAKWLVIGTATGVICLRRLRDGAQLQCVAAHSKQVSALEIFGGRLASGGWGGTLSLWSLPSLREERRIAGKGFLSALAWSPDGKTLAVARNGRRPERTPELNNAETRSAQIDPSGRNVIELYSSLRSTPIILKGHRSVVSALAWSGTDLLSTSWDRTVRIWNTRSPGAYRILLRLQHLAGDVAASKLGGDVAIASWATEDEGTSLTLLQLLYPTQ
jgi:WD40 repeat protein